MLTHPFQTLVRELVTPSLPGFATACVQLIKPKAPGFPPAASNEVIETICESFATLIPLYPTVFRPFSSQTRTALRPYLAPTSSDDRYVPETLTTTARRVVVSLHYVAAKSTGHDEWNKLQAELLKELHRTIDQVFRAVDESWQPSAGYDRTKAALDGEPHGGDASAVDQLPPWTGLSAGADRLEGLFGYLGDTLRYATKATVGIPVGALTDAVCRVCVIARLSPKTQTWEQSVETSAAISRDEKEELWSAIPGVHSAALGLILTLCEILGKDMVPMVPEAVDHLARTFKSGITNPGVRAAGYRTLRSIFAVAGCTMSKPAVEMLDTIMAACCRDLQEDIGLLRQTEKASAPSKDAKKNGLLANADLFLAKKSDSGVVPQPLDVAHREAASALLVSLLSQLPQSHLKPSMRGLLDKTAILTHNHDAMYASVLNPYKDQRGRLYASILPYLARRFPQDQGLEVLRSNLRTSATTSSDMSASINLLEEAEDEIMGDDDDEEEGVEPVEDEVPQTVVTGLSVPKVEAPVSTGPSPFEAKPNAFGVIGEAPVKRKQEEPPVESAPKRQEVSRPAEEEEEDSDDESVHLNMELDEDDE